MRIGIVGPMGSGKTTMAENLVDEFGFTRVSLASPVKAIAKVFKTCPEDTLMITLATWTRILLPDTIYDYPHPTWEEFIEGEVDPMLKDNPPNTRELLLGSWLHAWNTSETDRELLQRIGTDCGRQFNREIWVNFFARNLKEGDVVIDDVRFPNEGQALKDLGFTLVGLTTPEEARMERLEQRDGGIPYDRLGHASETEIGDIPCDLYYENTGSLEDMHGWLSDLVENGIQPTPVQGEAKLTRVK